MQAVRNWLWNRWDFFLHHFLTHFCHFPPLPVALTAVVGLMAGVIGSGVGAQHLIYHDEPGKQLAAGFALGLVVIECLLIGYLFEYGRRRRQYQGGFLGYAVQTAVSFVLCLALVWCAAKLLNLLADMAGQTKAAEPKAGQPFRPQWNDEVFLGAGYAVLLAVAVFTACYKWFGPAPVGPAPGAPAPPPPGPPGGPSHFVYVFWLAVAGGAWYIVVTYIAGKTGLLWDWVRVEFPVGLALAVAVVYGMERVPVLRKSRRALFAEISGNLRFPAHLLRARYRDVALVFGTLSTAALITLSYIGPTASPVTPICALLLALLAAYGFLSVVVRRGLSILLAALVVMLALAGTVPYKFRFHGLDDYYAGADGPLDLDRQAVADWARQEKLVAFITELEGDRDPTLLRLRAAVKCWDDTYRAATRDERERGKLAEKQEAARKALRDAEYERFAARPDFSAEEKRFAGTRVVPLRDPRPGAPLERAAEDRFYNSDRAGRLQWLREVQFRPADTPPSRKKPLVIVTVSGGGLRSAAWTLRVLQELEKRVAEEIDPEACEPFHFPAHVRLIAGASGGMLGAGYYSAALEPPAEMARKRGPNGAREREMRQQYEALTRDFLTPLVRAGVYSDLPLFLSPSPIRHDRGRVLEETWERELLGPGGSRPLAQSFAELERGEVEGWRPSLVFSPMLIEDGRRVLVSNLDLRWVACNDGSALDPSGDETVPAYQGGLGADPPDLTNGWPKTYSCEAFELFRMFPGAKATLPLSTAIRMSASFPYFSPAASLPTWPRRRVVDAGYYDNYGVSVAAAWLFSGRHEDWIRENVSKVLIIQIRDGVSAEQRRLERVAADPSSTLSRSVEEFISPLEGLDNGRVGSSSFRNDGQLELLTKYFRASGRQSLSVDHRDRFLTTVTFEFPLSASLSWYLSASERGAIDAAAAGNVPLALKHVSDAECKDAERELNLHHQRLDRVAEWFKRPVPR